HLNLNKLLGNHDVVYQGRNWQANEISGWVQLFSQARVKYSLDEVNQDDFRRRRKSIGPLHQLNIASVVSTKFALTTQARNERCRLPIVIEEGTNNPIITVKKRSFCNFGNIFISSKTLANTPYSLRSTGSNLSRLKTLSGSVQRPQNSTLMARKMAVSSQTLEDCSVKREDESHTASVEALVRRCAECFGADGEILNGSFPRVLFLTHLWFMTSEQLLVLFTQLYDNENDDPTTKKRVLYSIRVWLKEFPHVFDLDQSLV
uniref:N-terminal Ras-GEF domain-containing protein n=1 Tax=Ciona savignyi TaxID=51511 RepID=H2YQB0_CIOSA